VLRGALLLSRRAVCPHVPKASSLTNGPTLANRQERPGDTLLVASSDQPSIFRRDTKECFQWRVRNIEYPVDVYDITADVEKNEIVVRVSHPGWKAYRGRE
jgi:hypothetical protein